jgi:hypothetical protein
MAPWEEDRSAAMQYVAITLLVLAADLGLGLFVGAFIRAGQSER